MSLSRNIFTKKIIILPNFSRRSTVKVDKTKINEIINESSRINDKTLPGYWVNTHIKRNENDGKR